MAAAVAGRSVPAGALLIVALRLEPISRPPGSCCEPDARRAAALRTPLPAALGSGAPWSESEASAPAIGWPCKSPGRPEIWRRGPLTWACQVAAWVAFPPVGEAGVPTADWAGRLSSATTLGATSPPTVRPGLGVPPPATAEAIDSWRLTRLLWATPTGPEVPLEPAGPAPTAGTTAKGLTVPPRLVAEAWTFSEGTRGPPGPDATVPGTAGAASAMLDAAVGAAGPAARAIRRADPVAVGTERPIPADRGCPVRATTSPEPRAKSAVPAAAVLSPTRGRPAERSTAASETTWSRLAGVPPAAAGVAAGWASTSMVVDGRLATRPSVPTADWRAKELGLAGTVCEPAGCSCEAVALRAATADGSSALLLIGGSGRALAASPAAGGTAPDRLSAALLTARVVGRAIGRSVGSDAAARDAIASGCGPARSAGKFGSDERWTCVTRFGLAGEGV